MPIPKLSRLKPYLSWLILGGTLFFLASAVRDNWQQVAAIRLDGRGWLYVGLALAVTLLSHIWAGWVWGTILRTFDQPIAHLWAVRVYLVTNVGKYLPGSVWHFYGRVRASQAIGVPLTVATLSVVLEPLLMAAAALMLAFGVTYQVGWGLQAIALAAILGGIHPRVLNPLMQRLSRKKVQASQLTDAASANQDTPPSPTHRLLHYPLLPLLGELGFVGLRGGGFLLTVLALTPIQLSQIPWLMSGFSLAWVLGLVVPGAPGGLGVFEATALALLRGQFPAGEILAAVAFYRLVSVLAEAIGAGGGWLAQRAETKS